jgi:hypothetical protein
MINKKKIILLCTLVMTFSNIGMSDEPKSQPPKDSPVVVRRKNQTLCGHDSVYVLLRLFNKDIDERKFQETLYNEGEEYSSFEDLRRIIDSIGLYSLCVKGDKWHKILSDAVGIGYRGNPDELIGDFYLFEKSGNKILLFLPPDKIFIVNANKFITRTNLGHALLVFKTQNGKYWALVKLVVGHYFFIILSVGAFIFAIYMILISWSDKKKKIKLVYGCIILLVACLTLLYSFIRFYRTPIKDDLMVVAPKNSIDLGCGNYGEEKDFEIPIKNVGKKPILINKAFSSCSCVSLNVIENVVKPNEIYKLKGLYKYPKSGDRNAHIYLIYNNGDSATKIILSGRNCKMATVNKKRLYFGQIQQKRVCK